MTTAPSRAVVRATPSGRRRSPRFDPEVPAWRARLIVDATTSGGLLAAVAPQQADAIAGATVIGRLVAGAPGTIRVR